MKIALIASCALLGACAITPQMAANRSSSDLCYLLAVRSDAESRASALQELNRRNYQCTQADLAIARAQSDAMLGAAAAMTAKPQPAPPVVCTTYQQGPYGTMTCR